jgi:uncharacterized protein (TIGR03435 family)
VVAAGLLLAPRSVAPQSVPATGAKSAFEVASIKPNNSGEVRSSVSFSAGGRFTAANVSLRELTRVAYGLQNGELVSEVGWINSARFDVLGKADEDHPREQVRAMIKQLLADRFKLAAHRETRQLPLYALVVDRKDGRLGPALRPSQVDCAAVRDGNAQSFQPGDRLLCEAFDGAVGPRFLAGGVTMAQLAMRLSFQVDRLVVEQTGLSGAFDLDLQWTPEIFRRPSGPSDQPVRLNGVEINPNGPSIFTALREQLGLQLESRNGPVAVLVIDSATQPAPD